MKYILNTTKLPDGSIYSNFEQTGQGTSNLGKYVISNCSGNRLDKKGKLVEITVFCKVEVDDGNKYWTKLKRTTGDSDAGVSKFKFLGGTNSFNKLKGTECTYAVSYFKNKITNTMSEEEKNEYIKNIHKNSIYNYPETYIAIPRKWIPNRYMRAYLKKAILNSFREII